MEIVFDIEIQETFADLSNHIKDLRVSVVCAYNTATQEYKHFTENNLGELWQMFSKADRLIGYNIEHFDLPVLNNYYSGDCLKFPYLDILTIIKDAIGRRIKLDDVAQSTLKIKKLGSGLDAVKWWKQGEIQKVIDYCMRDVAITKDLYEFGLKNKQLFYQTLTGALQPFPVNFELPKIVSRAVSGTNLSLPF